MNSQKGSSTRVATQSATVKVVFRLDRAGHLVSAALIESSGVAALDQEVLALVRRADPFLAPPAEIGNDQLQFTVPVVFAGVRPSAVVSTDGTTVDPALNTKLYGICRGC